MSQLQTLIGLQQLEDDIVINNTVQEDELNIALLEKQVNDFLQSDARAAMIKAELYYNGEQDILYAVRRMIGEGGKLTTADYLPNNKIIDNQYAKLVDQKLNYQLGKPFVYETESDAYKGKLKEIFNKKFFRLIRNVGYDSINFGIAWLYPYVEDNEIKFKRFPSYEILPFWKDIDHTELIQVARVYEEYKYSGDVKEVIQKVDVLTKSQVLPYIFDNGKLVRDNSREATPYLSVVVGDKVQYYGWNKVPLIPFKANNKETPLIKRIKTLQDAINTITSMFVNNMEEDPRNTVLVLKGYGGQSLAELRKNLALFGAVGLDSDGEIDTLSIEVNSENYRQLIKTLKDALISNGRGYDSKDDRMSNNPNQMNIQSMYSDIELDANGMEIEYQASFEELLYFVNTFFANTGQGTFNEEVEVTFNRDMLSNEKEIMEILKIGRELGVSKETTIAQVPYINDVQSELDRISEEDNALTQTVNSLNAAFGGVE